MKKKVIIITHGQPSTNPRMVKEVKALLLANYEVKVIYSYWSNWALEMDEFYFRMFPNVFFLSGGSSKQYKSLLILSKIIQKLSTLIYRLGFKVIAPIAIGRNSFFLIFDALRSKGDFYIAHTISALFPAYLASKFYKKKFAFDAEDFHSKETISLNTCNDLVSILEKKYLKKASYVSSASPMISSAYNSTYGLLKPVVTINNVFSLDQQPEFIKREKGSSLRLIWFSQSLGLDRGIQDVLLALQYLMEIPIHIGLVGQADKDATSTFQSYIKSPLHKLEIIPPCQENILIKLCSTFHIGLALERSTPYNRNICLTNKIFTYILSGNALLMSKTSAQEEFIKQYPDIGILYQAGDIKEVANIIRFWWHNEVELERSRLTSWQLAKSKLNWDIEQRKFINLVNMQLR